MNLCVYCCIGEPSSPIDTTVMATGNSTVLLSWSPPASGNYCIDHYIISVSNSSSTYNLTTNSNSITVDQLEEELNHSFTVRAVDRAGREGNESSTISIFLETNGTT